MNISLSHEWKNYVHIFTWIYVNLIKQFMRIFHQVPAKRVDYTHICSSQIQ